MVEKIGDWWEAGLEVAVTSWSGGRSALRKSFLWVGNWCFYTWTEVASLFLISDLTRPLVFSSTNTDSIADIDLLANKVFGYLINGWFKVASGKLKRMTLLDWEGEVDIPHTAYNIHIIAARVTDVPNMIWPWCMQCFAVIQWCNNIYVQGVSSLCSLTPNPRFE